MQGEEKTEVKFDLQSIQRADDSPGLASINNQYAAPCPYLVSTAPYKQSNGIVQRL